MVTPATPTAALLIVGNEILSGRTQDTNLAAVASRLSSVGIALREVRVVRDEQDAIVAAVNELRPVHDHLFTTGGIGPTHDDITVEAIAAAFNLPVIVNPEARKLLESHYGVENLTDARLRMARTPEGATLITNPVSAAPGVKIGNVYILAGVPKIMQAMMDNIIFTLQPGPPVHSLTVSGFSAESKIADGLAAIAARYPTLDIGSYPWARDGRFGTALVTRGTDQAAVQKAADEILVLISAIDPEATLSAG